MRSIGSRRREELRVDAALHGLELDLENKDEALPVMLTPDQESAAARALESTKARIAREIQSRG